jgi:hypothetical protein
VRVMTELLSEVSMVREIVRSREDAFERGICVAEVFTEGCVYRGGKEACDW